MAFDTSDLMNAREVLALEERAKKAAQELSAVSSQLMHHKMDLVISGWDWKRTGSTTEVMPQGRVGISVRDMSSR